MSNSFDLNVNITVKQDTDEGRIDPDVGKTQDSDEGGSDPVELTPDNVDKYIRKAVDQLRPDEVKPRDSDVPRIFGLSADEASEALDRMIDVIDEMDDEGKEKYSAIGSEERVEINEDTAGQFVSDLFEMIDKSDDGTGEAVTAAIKKELDDRYELPHNGGDDYEDQPMIRITDEDIDQSVAEEMGKKPGGLYKAAQLIYSDTHSTLAGAMIYAGNREIEVFVDDVEFVDINDNLESQF